MLLLLACADERVTVVAEPDQLDVLTSFVANLGDSRVTVTGPDGPARGLVITLHDDLAEPERWTVTGGGRAVDVHGGGILGVQYGLSDALEGLGYRFLHPYDTVIPEAIEPVDFDLDVTPLMRRRGLHLHTLHPIEGLAAVWMPSDASRDEAARIGDWVVKNRGNHVQWPGLDDITDDDTAFAAWDEHTLAVVDDFHARGLTVGLGVQLFGSSNLQEAYDLLDETGTPEAQASAIGDRIERIADVPWDVINLSFGEFFGEDPDAFIASTNQVADAVKIALPDAELTATIHVGNSPDQRVDYDNQNLQYYFLVQYADPAIVPWVHTVMFYDLFEGADGAYLHDEFDEHRAFLLDRLREGKPVGYFPESAYWVAFDNSVPQFLPLYVKTRAYDLAQIDAAVRADGLSPLEDHVLFSSGWEWGYWLNDRATLRMCAERDPWEDVVRNAYAGVPDGAAAGDVVVALAELQHDFLMDQDLARWMSGRDAVIDFGDTIGIISQPDRPTLKEIASMNADDRTIVRTQIAGVAAYADAMAALPALTGDDRYVAEVRDGLAADVARARFVAANTTAVLDAADGLDPASSLDAAGQALADGETVVARRAAGFHDPNGARWVAPAWENPTTYDYGYLLRADELCFWRRELVQARNEALDAGDEVPHCAL